MKRLGLNSPDDGIGIRVGLRSQILGVRLSSGAPSFCGCDGIGIRIGLKIRVLRVRLPPSAPDSGVSIMDNTEGFYPFNVGSIPARRTIFLRRGICLVYF